VKKGANVVLFIWIGIINSIVDIFKTPEITQTFFEIKLKDIVKTKQN